MLLWNIHKASALPPAIPEYNVGMNQTRISSSGDLQIINLIYTLNFN